MSGTLVDILCRRAAETPDREVFTWLEDGEREAGRRTFGELDRRARLIAGRLRERSEPGDRVLLLFGGGLDFIDAFFGCLYAGVLPVPAAPDYVRPQAALLRLEPIARDCAPRLFISDLASGPAFEAAVREAGFLPPLLDRDSTDCGPSEEGGAVPAAVQPDDLAFLQYTSGSTGDPKGVMVSHANLSANLAMLGDVFAVSPESVFVGWVPMFHDMGLVVTVLLPVFAGARSVLMSPAAFLQEPSRWPAAITRYRGTITVTPNFACDLLVRRVPDAADFDFSSLRKVAIGGEPIQAGTMQRFAAAFAPHGLHPESISPGYGLAEGTVGTAMTRSKGARTLAVDSASLERAVIQAVPSDTGGARLLVSSGPAFSGAEIRIVDPDTCRPAENGRVGEVWVAGPHVARGYWGRPGLSEAVFGARLEGEGDTRYLRTGDLGFIDAGDLFITGRIKDLIIVRGRNYYPQDIELTAQQSHPGVRPGCSAAFSVEVRDEERLVLACEIRPEYAKKEADIRAALRSAIAHEHGLTLHDLACLPPGRLPKTTSGKLMRARTRAGYLAGTL